MILRSNRVLLVLALASCGTVKSPSSPSGETSTSSQTILIGTYNVENFWDSVETNTDSPYADFSDKTSNWIKDDMVKAKARQVADAIRMAGNPDILGLQEIESAGNKSESLEALKPALKSAGYKYFALGEQASDNPVAVTTAVISKYPITKNDRLDFPGDSSDRDPQVVTIDVEGSPLRFYVNHWKSKRGADSSETEGRRIAVAKLIHQDIQSARAKEPSIDCIVVGDLNSNYNESQRYQVAETGIINGLLSTGDERMMIGSQSKRLYNLWFDLPEENRGSYPYDDTLNSIDNILLSDSLYDHTGLQYVPKSLYIVGMKPGTEAARKLINADGSPLRWQVAREGTRENPYTRHMGVGYSDHLPLVAQFKVFKGNGSEEKLKLVNPSTTEFGPGNAPKLVAPACTEKEAVDLYKTDITNQEVIGTCVKFSEQSLRFSDGGLVMKREGQFGVKVNVRGNDLLLSMTYSFGKNKSFLRDELQKAVGKELTYVLGRVGYIDGKVGVFANTPTEIIFK